MNGKLHSNAHWGDEDHYRDSTELYSHQPHESKQLHSHEWQHQHLKEDMFHCITVYCIKSM